LTASLSEKDTREKTWPKTPLSLSNALRRLAPNLRVAGISIDFVRENDKKRTSKIRLSQREQAGDEASAASEASEPQQNQGPSRTMPDAMNAHADDRASDPAERASEPNIRDNADLAGCWTMPDATDAPLPTYSKDSDICVWGTGEQQVAEGESEVL